MKTTTNYALKKPDGTDSVNIDDLNANMDTVDAQLKLAGNHAADATKHITTVATTTANGLMAAADKVKLNGVVTGANNTTIANNLTTTTAGSALDATQGKVLNDRLLKQERILTATLTAAGWSAAAPYTQTVTVAGITATDVPVVGVVLSGTADNKKAQQEAWNLVSEIETHAGKFTATCNSDKPAVNISIQMKGA